ncbi:MAG: flagellar biosynthesis protein FlhF, partial [Rhodothermales bacterium]
DQVLIDTPPIPAHEGRARKMLQRVQRLIDGLMPVEVQFVLNATRALESFDATFMKRIPLRPSAVVLTHLDETPRWGRIAEWLIRLQLPVRFVSTGPTVPESLVAFSPTWFVEKMMDL